MRVLCLQALQQVWQANQREALAQPEAEQPPQRITATEPLHYGECVIQ